MQARRQPPWAETPSRVVVEFLRSSGFFHRTILLKHCPDVLPPQLRHVPPHLWASFMGDVKLLALEHPYAWRAEEGSKFNWCNGYLCICCIAIGRMAGSDRVDMRWWREQLALLLAQHGAALAPWGARLGVGGEPAL